VILVFRGICQVTIWLVGDIGVSGDMPGNHLVCDTMSLV